MEALKDHQKPCGVLETEKLERFLYVVVSNYARLIWEDFSLSHGMF